MKTLSRAMATVLLLATTVSSAFAQGGAPIKATGHFGQGFWEASYRQQHAQDHAHILYYYGTAQQPVAPAKAQEHTTEIRESVAATQKTLAETKKAYADNKEVQAALTKVEAIHKKVEASLSTLDKQAEKPDNKVIHETSAAIYHDLEEADQELAKLIKSLKIAAPVPPKKAEVK